MASFRRSFCCLVMPGGVLSSGAADVLAREVWTYGEPRAGVHVTAVERLADQSRVVAGDFSTERLPVGGTVLWRSGRADGFVASLDDRGEARWTVQFSGRAAHVSYPRVKVAEDGSVLVAANYHQAEMEQPALPLSGSSGAFLAKYDTSGRLLWLRRFAVARGPVFINELELGPAGDVVVAGSFYSELVEPESRGDSGATLYVARYDDAGNLEWLRTHSRSHPDPYVGINVPDVDLAVDSAGAVHVAAIWRATDFCCPPLWYGVFQEIWMHRWEESGTLRSAERVGDEYDWHEGVALDVGTDDSLVLGAGGYAPLLIKWNANGTLAWTRKFSTPSYEIVFSVGDLSVGPDGRIHALGARSTGYSGDPLLDSLPPYRHALLGLDAQGHTLWSKTRSQPDGHAWLQVEASTDDAPLVFGSFQSTQFSAPTLASSGFYDGLILEPSAVQKRMQSGFE